MCICRLRSPVCNAHVPYCHLWPAWLYNIFLHYLINATICEKKIVLGQNTNGLIFCTTFVWNVPHSNKKWASYDQKRTRVFMESTRYSCPILKKFEMFQHICEKHSNIKFRENPFSDSCVVPWERTYRQIHKNDEANSLLCNFDKAPKKHSMHVTSAFPIATSRWRWLLIKFANTMKYNIWNKTLVCCYDLHLKDLYIY